ncbi:MAG: carbon-nitrogen family hydrolase [Pirellulales bacterium]
MQIVACQIDIAWEDKEATHRRVRELLRGATIEPGALIVLPEMFATGFSMHVDAIAEAADGPTHAFLSEAAREHRAFVIGGVVTRAADGRGCNDAAVFGPNGTLIARYTKMHPFTFGGETTHYQAGDAIELFDWGELRVAPFVCYDLRFPEVFRRAVRAGAELLVVIANWPEPREAHWLALLAARAIENQAYVIGVNRAGHDPHLRYSGKSLILGPRGETLAAAGTGEQLLMADIDKAPLVEYRCQFPALADVRADLLGG